MSDKPLVTVIVPVYGVEAYLDRCVQSIVDQTYGNLEIILVDDGSPDRCPELCDAWAEKDPRVRALHKPNGGLSSARNAGLDTCRGEYVSFVDSDDWISPHMIERLLDACLTEGVLLSCGGRYNVSEDTGQQKIGLCPQRQEVISSVDMIRRILTWGGCDSSACDKLFHRSLFAEHRFPEGRVNEDVAILYRVIDGTDRVAMCPEPFYYYWHRRGSITSHRFSPKSFHFVEHTEEILAYAREHRPEVEREARSYHVYALIYTMSNICKLPRRERALYKDRYRALMQDVKEERPFWRHDPLVTKRQRIYCRLLLHPAACRLALKLKK